MNGTQCPNLQAKEEQVYPTGFSDGFAACVPCSGVQQAQLAHRCRVLVPWAALGGHARWRGARRRGALCNGNGTAHHLRAPAPRKLQGQKVHHQGATLGRNWSPGESLKPNRIHLVLFDMNNRTFGPYFGFWVRMQAIFC
jgi:hypothetical protein